MNFLESKNAEDNQSIQKSLLTNRFFIIRCMERRNKVKFDLDLRVTLLKIVLVC